MTSVESRFAGMRSLIVDDAWSRRMPPSSRSRLPGPLLGVIALGLALGGCFLAPTSPRRPDPAQVSGPVVYAEGCQSCHAARVDAYARSAHAAAGVRCGQCHAPAGHPGFTRPVRDATCGGCHQSQFQQTVASAHFIARLQRPLDTDRAARAALRRDGFSAITAGGRTFVGDVSSKELGGRLCAACHYDEHRLGVEAVRRPDFCVACHDRHEAHHPVPAAEGTNRCVACHVRIGETLYGQTVNTHRFTVPGTEASAR
jgi:hypothetical protein